MATALKGRKAYNADLRAVMEDHSFAAGITAVKRGDDDGCIDFDVVASENGTSFQVTAMLQPDVFEYPSSHQFLLVAEDSMPTESAKALAKTRLSPGISISAMLKQVSKALALDRDGDCRMSDEHSETDIEEEEDVYDSDDEPGNFYFTGDDEGHGCLEDDSFDDNVPFQASTYNFRSRIRQDLTSAKVAGFRVGHFGGLLDGHPGYLIVSCRVGRLGISEEAMQAWHVDPKEYLILAAKYPAGYKTLEDCAGTSLTSRKILFSFGVSSRYKPTKSEVIDAFATNKAAKPPESKVPGSSNEDSKSFRPVFISSALDDLFNKKFPMLLKYRLMGMSWSGAEIFFNEQQGKVAGDTMIISDKYKTEHGGTSFPSIVMSDHIASGKSGCLSLPLVSMQFLLRHFVRCTEFCLVCHRKMPAELEAISPYVCDQQLCLFQYMQLGFGPSIEHEIINQPKVIDLLISLSYAAAAESGIKYHQYPRGMRLKVPAPEVFRTKSVEERIKRKPGNHQYHAIAFDESSLTIQYNGSMSGGRPVELHEWVVIENPITGVQHHCCVTNTSLFPCIEVSRPIRALVSSETYKTAAGIAEKEPAAKPSMQPARLYKFTTGFDDLSANDMSDTINYMLTTLPSVSEMRDYLMKNSPASLKDWRERISPPALGILRWIIASNRACIMQVDDQNANAEAKDPQPKTSNARMHGMTADWTQFKFLMGSPDKERRFIQALQTVEGIDKHYPSIFAWHGSSLRNWHAIIREGLRFDTVVNGRAYGNGVYFALNASTSLGYTNVGRNIAATKIGYHTSAGSIWPYSELQVTSVLALNEIVNVPNRFVCQSPCIVVDQLDWIQTRYLLVRNAAIAADPASEEAPPKEIIPQDPKFTPRGLKGSPVVLPFTAVSSSRRPKQVQAKPNGNKRAKAVLTSAFSRLPALGSASNPFTLDTDDEDCLFSDKSDAEDLELLEPEDPPVESKQDRSAGAKPKPSRRMTDFVPGNLDLSSLPMLKMPEGDAASVSATKRLQSDYKSLLKIQKSEPLHELGWYISPELIEETGNLYQWIVELHSFDPQLPLALEMKAKGIKSVVLEIRFGKDYPMAPPFVRVVRPRFLSFAQGGGGHVTAGGALCMQLLTNDGWTAVSSMESVLLQVRMAISSTDPKPAKLERGCVRDYGVGEAVEAYIRACNTHGWTVPAGFRQMVYAVEPPATGNGKM